MFNKGLDNDERQEGLLKRFKNIEDKMDNQLTAIKGHKNNQLNIKSIGYSIKDKLPKEAVEAFNILLEADKIIDYKKLGKDFGSFLLEENFLKDYLKKIISISDAETEQEKFSLKLKKLIEYVTVTEKAISKKESFLENIQNFYDVREMVIKTFKRWIIPLEDESYCQYFKEKESGWMKNPEKFMEFKNELTKYNTNFSAIFNLKYNTGIKEISKLEIKRFVSDLESG